MTLPRSRSMTSVKVMGDAGVLGAAAAAIDTEGGASTADATAAVMPAMVVVAAAVGEAFCLAAIAAMMVLAFAPSLHAVSTSVLNHWGRCDPRPNSLVSRCVNYASMKCLITGPTQGRENCHATASDAQ